MALFSLPRVAVAVVVLTGCQLLFAQTEFPDLQTIPPDVTVPQAKTGTVAAGQRTFVRVEGQPPEIYYVLSLPTGWAPTRRWPLFVELPGNGGFTLFGNGGSGGDGMDRQVGLLKKGNAITVCNLQREVELIADL